MSPLTDILKVDVGPFQSPGNASPAAKTLGIAKLIIDPGVKGSHEFFILMEISTDAAPGAVDDKDIAASNKGISDMNAHSAQESITVSTELPEYVDMETIDLACRNAGVLRLLTVKRTTDPLEGGIRTPLVIVITRLHPVNDADPWISPE